ncbi:unnamed protein product [Brachionus calyciflorus]|uniref:Protein kinase domain-containing protein n=1 Tax=Brachionus calyciflorus TaxID=104777 RepID=A0A814DRK0_9BILA|nr:unnamed protein product [Brachionus calyciflorus]
MLLSIYLNIFLLIFLEAYKLDYKSNNNNNKKSYQANNKKSYQTNSKKSNLFNTIIEVFKLSNKDITYLESQFNFNSLELIYPKSLDRLRQMKRGVLGTKFKKDNSKLVAIKFEFDGAVRARYDKGTRLINCNYNNIKGDPTEKYIASLMQNSSNFIKFYTDLSRQFINGQNKINIYVYERLPKSQNLLQWTEKKRAENSNNNELEKSFRKHFGTIHQALSQLQKEGYIYTDFKPENVLLDTVNDKAYLIDLESVVSPKSKFVCLRTVAYTPPLYTTEGKFIDSDGLSSKALNHFFNEANVKFPHDRILSWTYCFSIYSLMCTKGADIFTPSFQQKYKHWSSDNFPFMTYFGCQTGQPSKMFIDLINGCLVKIPKKPIFERLQKHPWLANEIKN